MSRNSFSAPPGASAVAQPLYFTSARAFAHVWPVFRRHRRSRPTASCGCTPSRAASKSAAPAAPNPIGRRAVFHHVLMSIYAPTIGFLNESTYSTNCSGFVKKLFHTTSIRNLHIRFLGIGDRPCESLPATASSNPDTSPAASPLPGTSSTVDAPSCLAIWLAAACKTLRSPFARMARQQDRTASSSNAPYRPRHARRCRSCGSLR